jgi:TonB family protein
MFSPGKPGGLIMAKRELDSSDERDTTQRSLGCVGLSAIAHTALLIAVILAPNFKAQSGSANGTEAGIELAGEIADAAPAGAASKAASSAKVSANEASAPVEVLLADPNDADAVELPAKPVAAVKPAAATKPAEKTQKTLPAKKSPAKIAKAKPVKPVQPSHEISDALSAARDEAAKKAAAPEAEDTAQPESAQPLETAANGDIETAAAAQAAEQPVAESESTEAVPLQIALPEKEALSAEEAAALQAPPSARPAMDAATANSTTALASSTAAAQQAQPAAQPIAAAPAAITTAPAGAIVSNGRGAGTASGTTYSRGGGTGYAVPLGVPVRDARALIAMPGNPKPIYPLADKIAGRQGTTILLGKVRNDGRVENIALEKSSGSRLMDESAAKAFSRWRYRPGQEGYVRLPVQFELVGDAKVIPAQLKRQ